jgi:hypothetical protein
VKNQNVKKIEITFSFIIIIRALYHVKQSSNQAFKQSLDQRSQMNSYWTFIENAYLCMLPEDIISAMIELSKDMDTAAKEKHFADANIHWYDEPDQDDDEEWSEFEARRASMTNPFNTDFQDFVQRYK